MNWSLNVKSFSKRYQAFADKFDCGNFILNAFLRGTESLDCDYGKTFVLLTDDDSAIIGFYNIGMSSLDSLDAGVRVKIGGAVHINGFALDSKYQRAVQEILPDGTSINLSDFLLIDCIERIMDIRQSYVGCAFITLCATERGYHLYKRNGFIDLDEDLRFSFDPAEKKCIPMYYPIDL